MEMTKQSGMLLDHHSMHEVAHIETKQLCGSKSHSTQVEKSHSIPFSLMTTDHSHIY